MFTTSMIATNFDFCFTGHWL